MEVSQFTSTKRFTSAGTFSARAPLPLMGTLGLGDIDIAGKSLPMEPCDPDDLWKFGLGYRIVADTGSGNSVLHGATRTLRLAYGT